MMAIKVGLILTLFVGLSIQASTPESPNYEAGVVEFNFEGNVNFNSTQILDWNLRQYLDIMTGAPTNLDIIVFPEMTLNGMLTAVEISEPSEKIVPCDNGNYTTGNLVKQISCSAKQYQRYVVVNMVTKAKCPDPEMTANGDKRNCSTRADGFSYYNTNVVFDRKGEIISRYRKFNLFGESVDKPKKPAIVTFDTDFGVKFGTFICFDLMFKRPALELIRTANVTDIIFTTMWFSELPFLTAVQAQQGWAFANNVNLIAAGANYPAIGSTGSGIYAGVHGSLISVMHGSSHTLLYTATVPKRTNLNININYHAVRYTQEHMKTLKLKRDQLDNYKTVLITNLNVAANSTFNSTITHNNVTCNFRISYQTTHTIYPFYHYMAAAYDFNRTFDGFADGGISTCAIFACLTKDISTCGIRNETYETNIHWNNIEVIGSMPNDNKGQYLYMPTSLDTSIMPLSPESFLYAITGISSVKYTIIMTSNGQLKDLLAFGIYGRNFNLDTPDEDDGVGNLVPSMLVIAFVAVITFWSTI